ncbi:hypothetical protein MMC29_005388 [Sticta canariensis]|nr:hypothetical protein [Sticta canariensis]
MEPLQQSNKDGDLVSGVEFSVVVLRAIWRVTERRISRSGTQAGLVVVTSRIMAQVGETIGTATEQGVQDGVEGQGQDRPGHRIHLLRLQGTKALALAQRVGDSLRIWASYVQSAHTYYQTLEYFSGNLEAF